MALERIINKNNPALVLISARLEAQKLNFDEANEHLNNLLRANPMNGEVIMKKAENAFMCEKYYEAEELFFRALQSNNR